MLSIRPAGDWGKYLSSIGIANASHLRDVLSLQPIRDAKTALYEIFAHLQNDFNDDLFSDDLEAEARKITHQHISTLRDFFDGTHVRSGQRTFWPYDFSAIPIETISAIYEHFLKATNETGAFIRPAFWRRSPRCSFASKRPPDRQDVS